MVFDYHINYYSDSENRTNLPFGVFGMSQQGFSHIGNSIGNQDAGTVYLGRNIIIGSVADGCTSGNNLNGKSSNQVGASIISYLTVRLARKLILKKQISLDQLHRAMEKSLMSQVRKISSELNPWKFERNRIITNFLTSTFILFVVTAEEYLVLNCGDGNAFVNGNSINLGGFSGLYFSANLIKEDSNYFDNMKSGLKAPINCLAQGNTKDLQSLLIATDGFIDSDLLSLTDFSEFFFQPFSDFKYKSGINDLKFHFRNTVVSGALEVKQNRLWPLDDATFISIKRVNQ